MQFGAGAGAGLGAGDGAGAFSPGYLKATGGTSKKGQAVLQVRARLVQVLCAVWGALVDGSVSFLQCIFLRLSYSPNLPGFADPGIGNSTPKAKSTES